jgi:alpha-galactosidase
MVRACRWVASFVALLLMAGPLSGAEKPIKVFILAGQSNMQGHASSSTFESMAIDPRTAPLLKSMLDDEGKPRVCQKVWITSIGCLGDAYSDLTEKKGNLTVGFGAPDDKIGPEFTFGLHLEETLNERVLIIKTAWGGRSLHTDFRPPSAGTYVWSEFELAQYKDRGEDLKREQAERAKATGVFYREMIAHVRKVLEDIERVVPGYSKEQGYELAGFVWFQGFNDYVSGWTYPEQNQPGGYDLYAELLAHLIRDVRKDLSAPKMPAVIGVMGIDGLRGDKNAPMMHFRAAQRKPATLEEFQGNVVAVETAPYWDDEMEALQERMDRLNGELNQRFEKAPNLDDEAREKERAAAIAKSFTPRELNLLKGVSNGGYHYLGAAKILAPIGKAFAVESLKLLETQASKN